METESLYNQHHHHHHHHDYNDGITIDSSSSHNKKLFIDGYDNDADDHINSNNSRYYTGRHGRSFCGCCCDMRRAVIIINILNIIYTACTMIATWVLATSVMAQRRDDDAAADDDAIVKVVNGHPIHVDTDGIQKYAIAMVASGVVSITLAASAIMGAIQFISCLILFNILCIMAQWILSTVLGIQAAQSHDDFSYTSEGIIDAFLTMILLYPHLIFYQEIRRGIMTRETYANEAQSCCCV